MALILNNNNVNTGTTNVYTFLDESGNVTQIKKIDKHRNKYYIDPDIQQVLVTECVIGITDEESGPCSYGLALGLGDSQMSYSLYK